MTTQNKLHKSSLYNTLLSLSRNIFFYRNLGLPDTFESRIYLMFIHFSIMLIITKKKGSKFNQESYDNFFNNIEYNLRELGFGDVTVNKKMKDLNKLLYDILLKIEKKPSQKFELNQSLIFKYFNQFDDNKRVKYGIFERYFIEFYEFCFELSAESMIIGSLKFEFNYGSS